MIRILTATSMAITLAASPAAIAQPEYDSETPASSTSDFFGPQGGEWEVTLAGAGSSDKDLESGSFNIDLDASYYYSELLSVGVRQNVGYVDTNIGGDD